MKVCDQYGICMPIKVYKFEEEVPVAAAAPLATVEAGTAAQYITRDEVIELIKEFKQNEQSVPANPSKYTTIKQPSTND